MEIDKLITKDHQYIKDVYNAIIGAADKRQKRQYINEFIRSLTVHTTAEEIVLYPAIEARLVNGMQSSNEARNEHQLMKNLLYRLDRMKINDPSMDQLLEEIVKLKAQHMEKEENELLPALSKSCYEMELRQLGEQFQRSKRQVPTHPHPWAPNKP